MKKISNVELRLHHLTAHNVIATSGEPKFGASVIGSADQIGVGARSYYDEEEDF